VDASFIVKQAAYLLNLELLLHLIVESGHGSCLVTLVNVLPSNGSIAAPKNILVDAGQTVAEGHGPPLAVLDDLELHTTSNRLSHAVGSSKGLHLERLLSGLPVLQSSFERVGRGGCGLGVEGGCADTVAESIVDARGGGSGGCVRDVSVCLGVGVAGDDAHCLRHIGGCACWFYVEGGSVEDTHVAVIRSVYCSWLIRWWR
jgi:hypothetical protein